MYSLLDGLAKIEDLVAKAREFEMPALALTDHGAMYGVIDFYKKCKEANVKPIIGLEVYIAPHSMHSKRAKIDANPYHLVLLAKNQEGYKNLIQITTAAHLEGYYYKPRVDRDFLRKHSQGIIALSSCLRGEIAAALLSNNAQQAEKLTTEYQEIFGRENFYLELQDHPNMPEQGMVNQRMIYLAQKLKAPLVATNDVHYLNPQDQEAHEILLCIQTGKTYQDNSRMSMKQDDFSFKSPEIMKKAFKDTPSAIENTLKIAEQCNVEIPLGQFILPSYQTQDKEKEVDYLRKLCQEGAVARFGSPIPQKVQQRLTEELSTIEQAGFAPYFLIVWDFCQWAKKNGIAKGPGRGSSAGSLVAYLLGITDVDPLKYNLIFERFLSKEGKRVAPPDIDLDFAEDKRERVIDYLSSRYGKDRVAQIVTFGTMAARAAVRDVARALGMTYSQGDEIAKLVPFGMSLSQALDNSPLLAERYQNEPQIKKLIDLARQLEGVARHASTHAAGVVIGKESLTTYVPLQQEIGKSNGIITQYSMYDLESLGLLKVDVLGLANLTIIENTLKIIEKTAKIKIVLDKIPLNDPETFKLLSLGETHGIFQLESEGMKKWLKELKPTTFNDIIAMVALYRPGPMSWIADYIAGKHARKKPKYLHPKLEPILKETYGVPVYQEQIMQIARSLAGFSYAEADVLRKAIGKKIKKLLVSQREKFIEGCIKNGISEKVANQVFDFFEPFARYSFNKSHSTCYALIAYWTAYLKAHFPSQYMAALLTNEQNDLDKLSLAIKECKRMGIEVLPPDVNESWPNFAVVPQTNKIRFGLSAIKNIGEKCALAIVSERKKKGLFNSLEDFLFRCGSSILNKKSLESLIKCGALDRFGERTSLLAGIEQILKFSQMAKKNNSKQLGLFGQSGGSLLPSLAPLLPKVPPASNRQKLSWEKELLGMYLSQHPLSEINHIWQTGGITPFSSLSMGMVGKMVKVAGLVNKIQKIKTRNDSQMAFLQLEDQSGTIEVVVFPKVLSKDPQIIQKDTLLYIKGRVSQKDHELKIIAEEIKLSPFEQNGTLYLTIPPSAKRETLTKIKEVLQEHQGQSIVVIRVLQNNKLVEMKTKSRVKIDQLLLGRLTKLLGDGRIEVRGEKNGNERK